MASRTPQPAIEIGIIVISITGGTRRKASLNLTGAAIDCATHQAITRPAGGGKGQDDDRRFAPCVENHPVRDHRAGMEVMGRPPFFQPWPFQHANDEKAKAARERGEVEVQSAERPFGSVMRA